MAPGREDGGLIEQVGKIGAGKTWRAAGPIRQRHRIGQGTGAGMHRQDLLAAPAIGQIHRDPSIKAARTHQGRIEHIRPVGGRQKDHTGVVFEAIHLREQLVERLLPFVVAATDAGTPLAAHGIDFIDENDAGCLGLRLAEQIPHPRGPHAHEHLHKFRGGHREKGHPSLAGNRFGQEGFARARRAHQEHPFGNLGAHGGEAFGGFEEGDHLRQLLFGFGDPRHIFKAHRHAALSLEPGFAAAKAHCPVRHLGGAADQQGETAQQQNHQQAIGHQTGHRPVLAVVAHRQGHLGPLRRSQQQLIVAEHRHLGLLAILEAHLHLALAQRKH